MPHLHLSGHGQPWRASAEGQADVLAHLLAFAKPPWARLSSARSKCSALVRLPEGIETFIDKHAYEADGVFLVGRVKWHTDFSGGSKAVFKMMAVGVGQLAGFLDDHAFFAYRIGLEKVIRAAGSRVFDTGKILGGLAIQEGAHHETAGLVALNFAMGREAAMAREEQLLAEVKSWMAKLPAPEIDVLIVDELGKNISGAGMDTKVINRSITCQYNPFENTPFIHRIYVRGISSLSYRSAVGVGMADVIHDRLLNEIDWKPTYINSLTASTPAAIRTPIHFSNDVEVLSKIALTVGKTDPSEVTYCRIRNTLELANLTVSENLVPSLYPHVKVVSEPFALEFNSENDLVEDASDAHAAHDDQHASSHR